MPSLIADNINETYPFSFDIEKPVNIDSNALFTKVKEVIDNRIFAKIMGDDINKCGKIIVSTAIIPLITTVDIMLCLILGPTIIGPFDTIYEYKNDEEFVRITIHKKRASIIGAFLNHFKFINNDTDVITNEIRLINNGAEVFTDEMYNIENELQYIKQLFLVATWRG